MSSPEQVRPEPLLTATGITAGYGTVPVIQDVSLQVAPKEIVLVIGPNGAGKSTLVKTINGQLKLMGGSVHLAGADISTLSEERRALQGMGYVPQSRDVFPTLTVAENLEMGGFRLSRQEAARRVKESMELFPQLGVLRKLLGRQLSGGERKLLGVARALISDPKTLLLDEPTANLSPGIAKMVLEDIVLGLAQSGRAVLLIEQRVALALEIATWVYVLVDGKPRFSGSVASFKELPDMGDVFFASADAQPRVDQGASAGRSTSR
jgi:branched-chain amino acid transport system ATP-binding protein